MATWHKNKLTGGWEIQALWSECNGGAAKRVTVVTKAGKKSEVWIKKWRTDYVDKNTGVRRPFSNMDGERIAYGTVDESDGDDDEVTEGDIDEMESGWAEPEYENEYPNGYSWEDDPF